MEAEDLKLIISVISKIGSAILALNVFLFFKSYRNKTIAFKIITFYLLYVLIIQLRMSYLSTYKEHNLHYIHFYFIGQFVFLSFFFMRELKNKLLSRIIKTYLILSLISISIFYFLYPKAFNQHNIFEVLITSAPLIVYSFTFLVRKIDDSNKNFIYFNSGLFLYILCSTLIFIAGNLPADIKLYIWLFNAALYIVYQLLTTLEWYKNFRKPKLLGTKDV